MTQQQFEKLVAEGHHRIPVVRQIMADLDTPVSTYLKIAAAPYSYLFESVQGGEKWGRYSIIGLPCRTIIRIAEQTISIEQDGEAQDCFEHDDPLSWIEQYQQTLQAPELPNMPRFTGGLVGYFGYDTVRYIEPKLGKSQHPDPLQTPDIMLMVSDEVVVFDNLTSQLYVVVHVDPQQTDYAAAQQHLDTVIQRLQGSAPARTPYQGKQEEIQEHHFESMFTEQGFKDAVEQCKEYIRSGDIMQVVLSQRLTTEFNAPPIDLYRALRCLNPSPYMYFMDMGDFQVVGSSPEILVRLEHGNVTVRPIAGTRRRGYDEQEDQALEQELLADPKEIAEHLMLIDLGRNDAGRVSEIGSVQLTDKMVIERYSHVMHIVSNVQGKLREGMSAMDVLRATFPAGTVSGAPKIRAMEIIDEFEPVKRGIYSGAVGYLSFSGHMDTAIAIRTAVIKDGILSIQAGAGIVADSLPHLEWKETMNKGRAVFRAVTMAEKGIDKIQSC